MQLIRDTPLIIAIMSEFSGGVLLVAVSGEKQVRYLTHVYFESIY